MKDLWVLLAPTSLTDIRDYIRNKREKVKVEIKCDQNQGKNGTGPYYLNSEEQQAKSNRYFSQEIISASRTYFLENTHSPFDNNSKKSYRQ